MNAIRVENRRVVISSAVAFVIHTDPATVFIARSYKVWKALFKGNAKPWVTIKVTAKKPWPLNNPRRRINLWDYEGKAAEKILASLCRKTACSTRAE